ncbi:MAG: alginate lyase family protein [Candidatus Marinimicrobia bacterium]|nr:alginate lyase family protein [Candidatus Neomarinimicrobiota bacterium]
MNRPLVALAQILFLGLLLTTCSTTQSLKVELSHTGMFELSILETNKQEILKGSHMLMPAYDQLKLDALVALDLVAPSVMDKVSIPPSGDKHDYTSMGPYWWPNPDTPDGLPYVRKDGQVNPERNKYDKVSGSEMSYAVKALALMYYFSEDEIYAKQAAHLLRTWFISLDTRMNPNLNYGQFVPGRSVGRSVGIIESRDFVFLTSFEPLLQSSEHWTKADHHSFVTWMDEFRVWLVKSDLGQQEFKRANNHGSWYDYQVLALSHFCDRTEETTILAESVLERRLEHQIEPTGEQLEELARTKSFNYSVFNIEALTHVAIYTQDYGIDLYQTKEENPLLVQAIDFLLPYIVGDKPWPYKQISSIAHSQEKMIFILARAYAHYKVPEYMSAIEILKNRFPQSRYNLTTRQGNITTINQDLLGEK